MGLVSTPVVDNMHFGYVFCVDPGEGGSLEVHFEDNDIKLSKSNVSRSVVALSINKLPGKGLAALA